MILLTGICYVCIVYAPVRQATTRALMSIANKMFVARYKVYGSRNFIIVCPQPQGVGCVVYISECVCLCVCVSCVCESATFLLV